MDWKPEKDLTMDFAVHSHDDDKTTAVITQLVELANLLSNHLGSNIDPNVKPTTPSQKKGKQVDVVRLTAKPIAEGTVAKGFVPNRRLPSRDFTGDSISKEEEQEELNIENVLPQMAVVGTALAAQKIEDDLTEKADAMTTSEGKALLTSLQEAANKLRKFLMTSRVPASSAQKPSDMR